LESDKNACERFNHRKRMEMHKFSRKINFRGKKVQRSKNLAHSFKTNFVITARDEIKLKTFQFQNSNLISAVAVAGTIYLVSS
jgi:hypothetical protein